MSIKKILFLENLIKRLFNAFSMEYTAEELTVLKTLVEKELDHVRKDGEKLIISNAPFINKVAADQADLPYLKSFPLYLDFLEQLLKKL